MTMKASDQNKKVERGEIVKMILMTVGAVGVLAVGVVCPNLLQLMKPVLRKRYQPERVKQAFYRLDKKGHLIIRQTSAGWAITLTEKGRLELLAYELGQKQLQKRKHWDGKWHCLMFDIPEKQRTVREQVRKLLGKFGFHRLQDSVWVFPYECREVLDLLRTKYQIRAEALYVVVESLENDRWLKKHFGLK
ncbi:MAG: CRISPR-associated endonuclease Cas2 [Candidatus Uhrbacteria bacterium]|nr:CRISPR-associated endonuclease Cas2 [Candidatus Uhrbacteria bacterium]